MQVRHAKHAIVLIVCGGLWPPVAAASTPTRAYAGAIRLPRTRCSGNATVAGTVTSQILSDTAKYYYP